MRISTRTRLFLYTLAPVFLAGVALDLVLGANVSREAERETWAAIERVQQVCESRLSVWAGDPRILDETVRVAAGASGVRVSVIAAEGGVLADSDVEPDRVALLPDHADRPEVRSALAYGSGRARRVSDTVGVDLAYSARRIDTPVGTVVLRMAYPVHIVEGHGLRRRLAILGVTCAAVALGMLGAWLISAFVAKRVQRMAMVAERMADGDFAARVDGEGSDELARLSKAMNRLAESNLSTFDRLEAEGRRVRAILEAMQQGVMAIDRDGRVALVNEAMRRLLAHEKPVEGMDPAALIRTREILEAIGEARNGNTVFREVTISHPWTATVLVNASPLPQPGGVLMVVHETTEIHRVHQMRRDFVANVSHELRNPIGTLQAAVETFREIREAEKGDAVPVLSSHDDEERLLETMTRQTERMAALVRDLLGLARIESGQLELKPHDIEMVGSVREITSGFNELAQSKGISLTFGSDVDSLPVRCDPSALQTVLGNLLDNAVKYSRQGDSIRIFLRQGPEETVEIDVGDTGPGIAEVHLPRLFERFYRIDAGRSREVGGTGLGLAIVKHLALAMGGAVRVSSRVGEGTTFTVTLPRNV